MMLPTSWARRSRTLGAPRGLVGAGELYRDPRRSDILISTVCPHAALIVHLKKEADGEN
jgi:hypothetical protein